jgi:hypothetical protein
VSPPSDVDESGDASADPGQRGPLQSAVSLLTGRGSSLVRLRAEIDPLATEIAVRKEAVGDDPWIRGAEEGIADARAAAAAGRPEVGWRSLLHARRLLVHTFDPSTEAGDAELRARATAVAAEAEEKLDGWRLAAVRDLLSAGEPPTPGAIYAAAEILDARHGNAHRRVALVRKQVLALALVEFVGVGGVLALATLWRSPFAATPGSAVLLVAVALFGLMGASAGRLISLVGAPSPEKLPVLAMNWWMTVGRTLMGAAAALALYAFLHSGLLAVGGVDVTNQAFQALVLAVAFAAGFSERLLERAVAAVGGTDESPTPADRTGERGS